MVLLVLLLETRRFFRSSRRSQALWLVVRSNFPPVGSERGITHLVQQVQA